MLSDMVPFVIEYVSVSVFLPYSAHIPRIHVPCRIRSDTPRIRIRITDMLYPKFRPTRCIGYTHDLTACYPILSEILDMRGYGTDMTRILHGYGRRYMNTPPPELTLNENGGNHSFLRLAPLAPDLHRHICECVSCAPIQYCSESSEALKSSGSPQLQSPAADRGQRRGLS